MFQSTHHTHIHNLPIYTSYTSAHTSYTYTSAHTAYIIHVHTRHTTCINTSYTSAHTSYIPIYTSHISIFTYPPSTFRCRRHTYRNIPRICRCTRHTYSPSAGIHTRLLHPLCERDMGGYLLVLDKVVQLLGCLRRGVVGMLYIDV